MMAGMTKKSKKHMRETFTNRNIIKEALNSALEIKVNIVMKRERDAIGRRLDDEEKSSEW